MSGWIIAFFVLIAGVLGLWFVWKGGAKEEAVSSRVKASAALLTTLVTIYFVGHSA